MFFVTRILISLFFGGLAGTIAGNIMNDRSRSIGGNIILGIVGSFIGNAVFRFFGFYAYGWFSSIIVSIVGACIFIWVGRKLF